MVRQYILNSVELGEVVLQSDPIGWDNINRELIRDNDSQGVIRKRSAELRFYDDGLVYIKQLENLKGTEAVLNVRVLRKEDYRDNLVVEFDGIANLNPFDEEYEGEKAYVKIKFEDSGFHNKFITRKDIEVDTGLLESIEGLSLGVIPTKKIQIQQRVIAENNKFQLSENVAYSRPTQAGFISSDNGHVLPFEKFEGDSLNVETPIDYFVDPFSASGLIYGFIPQPAKVKIVYDIAVLIGLSAAEDGAIVLRRFTDPGDLNIFSDTVLQVITNGASNNYTPSGTLEIEVAANEAFTILADLPVPLTSSYEATYSKADLQITVVKLFADDVLTDCHYRYEYLQRICQIITDQVDCLKSDVFGRVENGYLINGKFSNNAVMSGLQIRGFVSPPKIKLSDVLKSIRAIWNVGAGVEKINRIWKVVVEEMPYFFRGDISTTLHNCSEIKQSNAPEYTYSDTEVGYEEAEYEEINGLEEYNNRSRFATFIKTAKNTLNLVSVERADGYGGEFARRKHKSIAVSEDTRYDEKVFTYMVDEVDGVLKTQRADNYSDVSNILSPETAVNLDITPQRNLLRNSDWLRGCLTKYPNERVKFCSCDKTTDLSSTKTGEAAVVEQADIPNSNLLSSLWLNKKFTFRAEISPSQMDAMEVKPYSLVKWSPTSRERTKKYFYGWILDVKGGGEERLGQCILLRANLLSERLNLIDPEGLAQVDDSTPLPTSATPEEMGLEVTLEGFLEG